MNTYADSAIIDMREEAGRRRFDALLARRATRDMAAESKVRAVLDAVRSRGDSAVFEYTKAFDGISLTRNTIRLDPARFKKTGAQLDARVRTAIRGAARRIRAYHRRQVCPSFSMKTAEGTLSQLVRPLRRVGVYVPGGYTAYPSSVLMDVIPAQIAGVREIAVVTPPRKELDPRLAFVFDLLGLTEVYRVGGAQAIAALAYGTRSVPVVDKVVGPGNLYVSLAKKAVYGTVDIDMVAGPSEVVVLADGTAPARWAACDLLSQAEHGSGDELAGLVTESARYARAEREWVGREIGESKAGAVYGRLASGAIAVCVTGSRAASIALVNEIAPEHLQIMTRTARRDLDRIRNAAAVFLGPWSPVAAGDYFAGTNHVLPTGSASRFASPLGVYSFQKRMSVAQLTSGGLRGCGRHVSAFARAEGFVHHALSVERRISKSLPARS